MFKKQRQREGSNCRMMVLPVPLAEKKGTMKKEHTVLLVDDEPNILAALKRVLQDLPVTIVSASNGNEGLGILRTHEVHVVY